MNYHNITTDDMKNGDGLRVVLWVSGCEHHCSGCQNPFTWDPEDGVPFDDNAKNEIFTELKKDYISGITFSGGDPLHPDNFTSVVSLAEEIKNKYPDKTIWLYTGSVWEDYKNHSFLKDIDVLVDGEFIPELADRNYPWAGSTNQRVINVQESLKKGCVILHASGD